MVSDAGFGRGALNVPERIPSHSTAVYISAILSLATFASLRCFWRVMELSIHTVAQQTLFSTDVDLVSS